MHGVHVDGDNNLGGHSRQLLLRVWRKQWIKTSLLEFFMVEEPVKDGTNDGIYYEVSGEL